MPILTLKFENIEANISAQIGDSVYFCKTYKHASGVNAQSIDGNKTKLGVILSIKQSGDSYEIEVDLESLSIPTSKDFIFFSKDNIANLSTPTGYYANIKFVNDSTYKGEMFAASCEVFESSK